MRSPVRELARALRVAALTFGLVLGWGSAQEDATVQGGASLAAVVAALPAPGLFDVSWADFGDLLDDLHPPFVPEARTHAEAPVYHLDYVLEEPTRLNGAVEIRVVNTSADAWERLPFHLLPNLLGGVFTVDDVRVSGASAATTLEREASILTVALPEPLPPGGAVVVTARVQLELPTAGQRNYSLLAYRDGIVSLAHAYPLLAVYQADKGWDLDVTAPYGDLVFAVASWFRVRIEAPAELELVASGAESVEAAAAARRVWEVRAGPVRDLYLSLGDYEMLTGTVGGTEVRSWFLPGGRDAAREALDHAVHALRILGARWTPYPYRTFDMVPLTTEALGVEFPGVIALATRLYGGRGRDLPWVVVHEVAHQWFYGIAGSDQITHPWLDEAMAQYAVIVYARARYGAAEEAGTIRSLAGRWREQHQDIPIGLPVAAYTAAEYGSVVYGRGPLVIADFEERLGRSSFEAFVRGYVAAFRWRIATPAAFQAGLEAACACNLDDAFADVVYGGDQAP